MLNEWGAYLKVHAREKHTTVEELLRKVPLHPVYRESGSIPVLVRLLKVISHLPLVERFVVCIHSQDNQGHSTTYFVKMLQTSTLHPARGFMNTKWMIRADFVKVIESDYDELRARVLGEIQRQRRNKADHQSFPLTFAKPEEEKKDGQ